MPPAGKKADKRWRFIGQEVKDVEDLTLAHIHSIYGLSSGLEHDSDDQEFSLAGAFPYCGDRHSSSSTLRLSSAKGAACSAARCKDNPHCLNYMGQAQWEEADAFDQFYAAVSSDTPDPSYNKRQVDIPSGMKNLGATCYANSLLQVWFHDLAFRDAIYRCHFGKNAESSMNALYQLQLLFTHLDHGAKNVYNPLALVSSLKLDTTMQQDAQEFGNLFMACIDNQLQSQSDVLLREFIKEQFQGHYQYQTTCKNCKTTSVRSCVFYELLLNIKNNCTLMDCLEEFVEPELLVGEDRYACSTCGSLQDASREIKLQALPPVLNIQLMRFVYDGQSSKRKSKDTIRFPRSIDFSGVLHSKETAIYDLSAVLVHSGASAHSGHFLAHVLDQRSQKWFVLNDEEVAEFNATTFDPEETTKSTSKSSLRIMTISPGASENYLNTLSSQNAYMMTYTKRARLSPARVSEPPSATLEIVKHDNDAFLKELEQHAKYQETIRRVFESARNIRREIYLCWSVSRDEDGGCYVSSEALAKYMRLQQPGLSKDSVDCSSMKVDNTDITCEHRKLCPSAVTKSKRISEAARLLLETKVQVYIDPVLTADDICVPCARNTVQDKLYNIKHRRDVDEFERKAKAKAKGARSAPAAWLSKAWLVEWLKVLPQFHPSHGTTADDPSPMSEAYWPDVFCPHSCLSSNKLARKLINEAALGVLERVFGPLSLPVQGAEECQECLRLMQPHMDSERDIMAVAASEKRELADLINRGATIRRMEPGVTYFAVSQDFRKLWLEYIKRPTVSPRPASLDNYRLLCDHGELMFDLDDPVDVEDESGIGIVKEEEWRYLQALYGGAPEVSVTKADSVEANNEQSSSRSRTVSIPMVCSLCRSKRILDYSSTTFTVRVYSVGNGALSQLAPHSEHAVPAVDSALSDSTEPSSKRRMVPFLAKEDHGTRRSKRTRATKNPFKQIKIPVNKLDTTMDLKLKIMQKTNIVPLYQKLLYEGVELDKNDKTIGEMEIPPNAVLTLIEFDDAMDELMLDALQDDEPRYEGGFVGTGLVDRWHG
ncbi:unnamed protein product [Mortierella alpina]